MEIRELRYIVTIYEEKSISGAAERLYMAQSSLSQFLNSLEAQLGCKLFVRTSTGVRPTQAGKYMVEYAYRTNEEFRRVQEEMQDLKELKGGSVILGVSSFRGSYLMPPVLKAFHMRYPDIHVQVVEANSMELEQKLLNGQVDLALIVMPEKESRLEARFLMKDEVCLITDSGHPVNARSKVNRDRSNPAAIPRFIDIRDIVEYEILMSPADTILGRESRKIFRRHQIKPITYNEDLSALFAAAMAAGGQGLAFTYYSSRHYFKRAAFFSLGKDGSSVELATALTPGRYQSRASKALDQVIHEILGEGCADGDTSDA